MEIVLENPSPPPSARTPIGASAGASSSATTATSQLGLPMNQPPPSHHHFSHRAVYDVGLRRSPPLLPTEDYYATRTRHGLMSYGDLDGASAPVTVRRVDKSGLLEIAETDPVTCPRPCVLTGAEDVPARAVSLRVDRSGLLEAVPEAADQPEEHCNNAGASSGVTVQSAARASDDAAAAAAPPARGGTLQVDVDVNPRVFEGGCLLERPSSLEGQACPDEVDARVRSADVMVLTGSPRTRYDVSKAAERLAHLPFSPGLSLRRLRSEPPRVSPLSGRRADPARPRNQTSPELAASAASRKLAKPPHSPRDAAAGTACSRGGKLDPAASSEPGVPANDAIRASRESLLLAKRSAALEDDPPGEERAEAEGCEHTTVESLEEDKVSFKGSNKLLDSDSVQTLRVIILSEQL